MSLQAWGKCYYYQTWITEFFEVDFSSFIFINQIVYMPQAKKNSTCEWECIPAIPYWLYNFGHGLSEPQLSHL